MAIPPTRRLDTLAIAAPAYNEAEGIEAFVAGWRGTLADKPLDAFEIVVCDDGSRDATGAILARLAARWPELRVVTHPVNRGGGAAMASAIAATRARWVLLTDADGQFPPDNYAVFEQAVATSDARAFLGARAAKRDSLGAVLGSRASTVVCNLVYATRYRDFTSACQLIEGDLLRALPLEARGLNYSLDILGKLLERGVVPDEVAIRHLARTTGRSSRTLIRSSVDRAGFVAYLALRRALVARRVLRAPT